MPRDWATKAKPQMAATRSRVASARRLRVCMWVVALGFGVVSGDFGLGCGVGQGGWGVLGFGVAVLGLVWYCVYLGTYVFGLN